MIAEMIPAAAGTGLRCPHTAYSRAALRIVTCNRPAKFLDTTRGNKPACGIHAKTIVAAR